jgi:hypothetical protein
MLGLIIDFSALIAFRHQIAIDADMPSHLSSSHT